MGKGGEHIEIGDVVVAHRVFQGQKAAVLAEVFHPVGKKILIVRGDAGHEKGPQGKGQPQREKGGGQSIFRKPRPFQQKKSQNEQGQHGEGDQQMVPAAAGQGGAAV